MEVGYLRQTNSKKKLVTKTLPSKHSLILTMLIALAILLAASSMLLAKTIYVTTTGDDVNHHGTSVNDAFRTIQRALDYPSSTYKAMPGDTVLVGAGTFNERVSFNSGNSEGTSSNRITLQGTLDGNGDPITTIDAGQPLTNWTDVGGTGNVWRTPLPAGTDRPYTVNFNGYYILNLTQATMAGTLEAPNDDIDGLDMMHNGPISWDTDYGQYSSEVRSWNRGVSALWGYFSSGDTNLYMGFGDPNVNPNNETITYALRNKAGGACVTIGRYGDGTGRDFITVKNFNMINAHSGILVRQASSDCIVENNAFYGGQHCVCIMEGCNRTIVRNNYMTLDYDNGNTLSSDSPNHWFIWKVFKEYSDHDRLGIDITDGGTGDEIYNNYIYEHWDGIQDTDANVNLKVYGNIIENVEDDGLEPTGDEENAQWYDNTVIRADYSIRHKDNSTGPMYVYRNKFYNANEGGIYWFSGNTGPAYYYHNTIVTDRGMTFGNQNTVGYPNVWLINNIFSNNANVTSDDWTQGYPHFDYNYVGGDLSTKKSWWGNNNRIVLDGQLWSANPPDFKLATSPGASRMGVDLSQNNWLGSGINALPGMDTSYYVNGTTPDAGALQVTPPGAPTNVALVSTGNGTVTLSYTAPVSDGNGPITRYTATSSPGGFTGYNYQPGSGQVTVSGLTNGTAYTFTIVAKNLIAGSGPASSPAVAGTPATVPGAPTIGTATRGNGQATVAFTAPASNGGSTITSYTATSTPGNFTGTINQSGSGSVTVTGLTNGTAYTFKVKATNAKGTGAESAASNSVTPATVPGTPTIGTATRGNGQATVAYTAPASNGGDTITTYTATSTPGNFTGTVSQAGSGSITVTGLTNGTAYTFKVKATNSVGTGSESAASNSVTPATVPGTPTIGTATRGNAQATVAYTAPASNGGSAITSYTATSTPGNFTGTVSQAGSGSITVTGLTNGTAYTFKVKATNSVGTGSESAASNSVTPATVPGTPTIGTATRGNGQATVAYTAPASNGGSAITSYTATSTPGNFTGTVSQAGSGSITVTGLANGTAYTFKVKATNSVGTGSESAASNSVTPATVPGAPTIGTATFGNNQATVAYTAPASNGGDTITSYTATSTPGNFTGIVSQAGSGSITVTGLTNGTAYTFKVKATNSVGTGSESAASNSVIPDAVPVNVSVTPSSSTAYTGVQQTFTSTFSDADGASDLGTVRLHINTDTTDTGVELQYKQSTNSLAMKDNTGALSAWVVLGTNNTIDNNVAILDCLNTTVSTNGNNMVVTWKVIFKSTMVKNCNLYGYSADTKNVNSGFTNLGSCSIINPTVPGAPTIGTATRGNGQATVAYTAPASNGGSTITSYTATSTPGNITGSVSQSGSGSITVTGLTNGTAYTFKVKATNSVGTGSESGASNSVTPATVPGAPTIGTATAGDGQAIVAFTAPASNGGDTITSYTATSTPGNLTGTVSQSGSGSITVTGLTNGTAYTFKVKATNSVGTGSESAASNSVTPASASRTATFSFDSGSYTANSPTGHWRYTATGGTLAGTAYTDATLAPDSSVGPVEAYANWQQVTGVSGNAVNWMGYQNAQHTVNTGLGTTDNTGWFTSTSQTLTVSAKVKFNQLRAGSYNQSQIFSIGIGQSGNTSQNLFHINGAVYSNRYPGGGTNTQSLGSPYSTFATDSIATYISDGTLGANSAIATNVGNYGTREDTVANWRGYAGVTVMKNDSSNYELMTRFAERGSLGTNTPAVTPDPNAISIAAAGPDGIAGNADDWYSYTMTIDFSAGDTAVYKVYINDILQATMVQNLPSGKSGSDYWTVRDFKIGSKMSFSGAIDNLTITDTIDDPSVLAEYDFSLGSYTANSPVGHWTYDATGGSLAGIAYTDSTIAPNDAADNTTANWQQSAGASGDGSDKSVHWKGKDNSTHYVYASSSATTTNSGWFTDTRQTLTISAKIRYDQLRYGSPNANDQNHMFSLGIGQSGDSSQNLFHVNAAVFSNRYPGGGTNPGGNGSPYLTVATDSISTYISDGTIGANSAVTTNVGAYGTRDDTVANWRGYAGVAIMKNDASNYKFLTKFAERGNLGGITPTVTADPNAVSIAAAGPDGVAGNTDDWYLYTITIDFSAGDTATYNVYIGNQLQSTIVQNLPSGKSGSDYWTIRDFKIGAYNYYCGAIDDLKITNSIEIPL